jgi:2-methylisocitrate lyase-like PEP mutase family enzyme
VPGAYDALSARVIKAAGFSAVYMTGFGTSAGRLGRPDAGLLTQTEMVDNARRIASAVDVPVIADADTGYGNPLNVMRTVQEYERAGVAAIHLEDQVMPKKCGHVAGKQVVPMQEMVQKLRAATAARRDPDFVLIARTDARATHGLAEAIRRGQAYRAAGADVVFIEAPESEIEVREVASAFAGVPLLYNWTDGGRTPPLPLDAIAALGFKIVLFPVTLLLAATRAMQQAVEVIRRDGTPLAASGHLMSFQAFNDFIGWPELRRAEAEYAEGGEAGT